MDEETSEVVEEEYSEEFSVQDLEFFIEITEFWEKLLKGEVSPKDIVKIKKIEVKPRPKRRRRK